ncbi:Metallo-beta-lactamase_superfamily/Beta-lactamase_superfamily_domain_containing_protein (plasmid) [Leishmania braziliensis MHOM/BR/75/M2904]|nr:Metallo-beta-lactamase_superfamily/Beta-lactamase_superfamily_domain_containing_protein [Leishmania braziliensis MHOM/BR/75/M2904]
MTTLARMRLTFVGTGVSSAIPVIGHLTTDCACRDAIANSSGPNCRNNVSLLISLCFAQAESDVEWHHVLVDCGKTFRNAYMRVLAPMRVEYVDALLITHGHADAMHCVEELCGMQAEAAARYAQSASPSSSRETRTLTPTVIPRTLRRVPTFLTAPTLDQIAMVSPELVKQSFHMGAAPTTEVAYHNALAATANTTATSSSSAEALSTVMDVFFMDEKKPQRMYVPFEPRGPASPAAGSVGSSDLPFYSFPVEHGKGYISMAWVFGRGTAFKSQQTQQQGQHQPEGSCVVYISDVSNVPATSMAFLQDLVKIDVLVLDLLAEHGAPSASHYCADEAIPLVVALAPRRTYFVGMFCSLEHHRTNELLALELAGLKAQYRDELEAVVPGSSAPAATCAERERKRAFVNRVCSMELAYDGQKLDMEA